MKIKTLNVYPIKALRPVALQSATLTPQGVLHDRTYMLFKVNPDSSLRKLQLSNFPQCALFSQEIVSSSAAGAQHDGNDDDEPGEGDTILVRYHAPSPPLVDHHPLQDTTLSVPLVPGAAALEPVDVSLHGSPAAALRMGDPYDAFFSACLGFPTILVHIGSGRRPVLGTLAPGSAQQQQQQQSSSLFSSITSYVPFSGRAAASSGDEDSWLTFTDCAPYLITSTSSLAHPSLAPYSPQSPGDPSPIMPKFRPNIVVDDPAEAPFAEDFWAELSLPSAGGATLLLTANCGRCSSLNVDYATGRQAAGQEGKLLNALMRDRRVDPGHKYAPIFGRYAFLSSSSSSSSSSSAATSADGSVRVRVGDEVVVTRRNAERTVFDWPATPAPAAAPNPNKPLAVA
ncbi:MOSC domain-containing protein [Colletotrichum sojae]|uniref:MOSC domain-containing protein n=1 Tax=Colletotrichum sojae TaxID=2175907 RepID=A0A8H6N4N8_9PEZI|nr:MOSC domain-containing protein [Colletotrichum sojae]